ncbi:MAG: hypothetical protein ABIS06_10285 [Vicinamibacterales bacterium]
MRTTLLNPAVWVLATTAAIAAAGAWRGRTARESLETMVGFATMWPVLMALCAMSAAGIGSRAVLGFLAPGAYAEEVAAARTFLSERGLYSDDGRAEVHELMGESGAAALPWAGLPGISGCQVNAITNRAQFFTNHAHTPMLLLAGVPLVSLGGSRGLYLLLLLLSCAAVLAMSAIAINRAGFVWNSRPAILTLAVIAGWQPVLAGVRQGDAVLTAAGLVAVAWYLVGVADLRAPLAAALASCLALPAIGVLPALARNAPRAAGLALLIFSAAAGATAFVAGPEIFPAFIRTAAQTATSYAFAPQNYGVAGRLAATGAGGPLLLAALAAALVCTWWCARTIDHAFAAFVALGLLVAPVVWSQHLALVFVPALVLLTAVIVRGSAATLATWSALVLMLSLPDIAVEKLGALVGAGVWGPTFPILPVILVAFWVWTVFPLASRRPSAATAPDDALGVTL